MDNYSKEFKYWYERIYLQSPTLCTLEYDDEKMWEAWKAAQKILGEIGIEEIKQMLDDIEYYQKRVEELEKNG